MIIEDTLKNTILELAEDQYTGSPPELADLPVFSSGNIRVTLLEDCGRRLITTVIVDEGFLKEIGWPYPYEGLKFLHTPTLWEHCLDQIKGPLWAEFGVEVGCSAQFFLRNLPNNGRFYLFDSFEGLPEDWKGDTPKGHFDCGGRVPNFDDLRVVIKKGWFEDTLPIDETLDFVHIDCDLYSSTKTVLENINVKKGTIILFDEFWGYDEYADHEYKALMEWDVPFKFIARDSRMRALIEVL
jgi:hypothetical protein